MRVIGPGGISQSSATKKKDSAKKADGSFGDILSSSISGDSESASAAPVQYIGAMDGLLSMQMVDDQTPKQKAIEHGNKLLNYLDELRHDLLMGNVSAATAQKIVQEIKANRGTFVDPKLQEIINDIELRAAVELAKMGI